MIPTEVTRNRWLTRVWGVLLVGQTILLSFALIAIVRGTPDAYLNQHARLAASAAAGICLASLFLARRPALQVVAMIGTLSTIVWQITLTA